MVWPCYLPAFPSYSSTLSFPVLAMWLVPILVHGRSLPSSGPVCLSPQGSTWLAPSPPLSICSNGTFSVRLFMTILFKSHPYGPQPPPFPNSSWVFIFLHCPYSLLIYCIIYSFLCVWLSHVDHKPHEGISFLLHP